VPILLVLMVVGLQVPEIEGEFVEEEGRDGAVEN
jgi:hypothetical protein